MSTTEATGTRTRNQEIAEAVVERGERGATVAARYGVTRERVSQIVRRESGLSREEVGVRSRLAREAAASTRHRDLVARVTAALLERPRDAESLATDLDASRTDVARALTSLRASAPAVRARLLRDRRASAAPTWSDADLEAELRRVATDGDATLGYVTGDAWAATRDPERFPSLTYVTSRYGSWSSFAAAAGLPAPPSRNRSYERKWSEGDVLDAVRRAIADGVVSGADYTEWTRERSEPSLSLVILRLAPLSWAEIRAAALTGPASEGAA